jgi:hypothetical protein
MAIFVKKAKFEKLWNQLIFGEWNAQKLFLKKGKSQQIAIFGSSKYIARNMQGWLKPYDFYICASFMVYNQIKG